MRLTKNFTKVEFESRDGSQMPDAVFENIKELVGYVQIIRDYIGKPIHINSGYRSVQHNENIGGVKNSFHTKGMAVDMSVKGLSPRKLSRVIKRLIYLGRIKKGGVGIYNGFVHYDMRGYNARWNKSTFF